MRDMFSYHRPPWNAGYTSFLLYIFLLSIPVGGFCRLCVLQALTESLATAQEEQKLLQENLRSAEVHCHTSVCSLVCLFVGLSVHWSVCSLVCLFVGLSVRWSVSSLVCLLFVPCIFLSGS